MDIDGELGKFETCLSKLDASVKTFITEAKTFELQYNFQLYRGYTFSFISLWSKRLIVTFTGSFQSFYLPKLFLRILRRGK